MKEFGGKLRELLKVRRISQERLGREIGKNQSTVNTWIQGTSEPVLGVAKKLAEFLDVSLDYLCDDSITEMPDENDAMIGKLLKAMPKEEAIRRLIAVPVEPLSNRPDGDDGGEGRDRRRKSS